MRWSECSVARYLDVRARMSLRPTAIGVIAAALQQPPPLVRAGLPMSHATLFRGFLAGVPRLSRHPSRGAPRSPGQQNAAALPPALPRSSCNRFIICAKIHYGGFLFVEVAN